MIQAIIFDLWETLGSKSIRVSKLLQTRFHLEDVKNFPLEYERSFQLRKWDTLEQMAENFLKQFQIPSSDNHKIFITDTVRKGIQEATLFEGMRELLEKLHEKYKLAILSNSSNFETAVVERWNIQDLFTVKVYSWQIGFLKPSKENFREICTRLGLKPEVCLFVDDGEKNVVAAKQYGMQAIQYKGVPQLSKELDSFITI